MSVMTPEAEPTRQSTLRDRHRDSKIRPRHLVKFFSGGASIGFAKAERRGADEWTFLALIRFKHPSNMVRKHRRTESRGGATRKNRKERKVHPDSGAAAARVEIADAVSTRSSPASTSVHPARLLLFITRGSPRPRPPRARAPRGTPAPRTAPCPSPVRWRWSRPSTGVSAARTRRRRCTCP